MTLRDEEHRRFIASLQCAICGIYGFSQAAHAKIRGKAYKEGDNYCVPLCCSRPEEKGCHAKYDQYEIMKDRRDDFEMLGKALHRISGNDYAAFELLVRFRNDLHFTP